MGYEVRIVCDRCRRVVTASPTAAEARKENRYAGGRSRSPYDLCQGCVALGHRIPDDHERGSDV